MEMYPAKINSPMTTITVGIDHDENSIVHTVCSTGSLRGGNIVEVDEYDTALVGKQWDGKEFVEGPKVEEVERETAEERLEKERGNGGLKPASGRSNFKRSADRNSNPSPLAAHR